MANNTGIVMEDEETVQETVADANPRQSVDAEESAALAAAEAVVKDGSSAAEQGILPPSPEGTVDENPTNAYPAAEEQTAVPEEKKYTQSQHDASLKQQEDELQKLITFYKDQSEKHKEEAATFKKQREEAHDNARRRAAFFADAYAQLDVRETKLFQLVSKYVQAQIDNEELAEKKRELDETKKTLKKTSSEYARLLGEVGELRTAKNELTNKANKLSEACAEKDDENEKLREELGRWQGVGGRIVSAMEPQCLTGKPWFDELKSELQSQVLADQPSDSAMLVFASLSELAVMERSPSGPCFEWKKQLADIGLVVASYMHQKKSSEGDVLKMLHNFAQAFQEMPILKKLKIMCWIPDLGGDFPTDKVKHKNNGTMVAKVHNWCIIEDGHVYCKAIVE